MNGTIIEIIVKLPRVWVFLFKIYGDINMSKQLVTQDNFFNNSVGTYGQFQTYCEFLAKNLQTNAGEIALKLKKGNHLGLDDLTAVSEISIIKGKCVMAANLILGLAMRHPDYEDHSFEWVGDKYNDDFGSKFTLKFKGRDSFSNTFTLAEAKRAELYPKDEAKPRVNSRTGEAYGKSAWEKFTEDLLVSKATVRGLRLYVPNIAHGIYCPEEMSEIQKEPLKATAILIEEASYEDQFKEHLLEKVVSFCKHNNLKKEYVMPLLDKFNSSKISDLSYEDLKKFFSQLEEDFNSLNDNYVNEVG
jgi:hypothetical protein